MVFSVVYRYSKFRINGSWTTPSKLHPGKLTWQWKNNYLKMCLLFKNWWLSFCCRFSYGGGKQQHIVKGSSQSTDVLPSALRGLATAACRVNKMLLNVSGFKFRGRFRLFQVKPGQPKKTHFFGFGFLWNSECTKILWQASFRFCCEEVTAKLLIQYNHIQT